MDIQRVGVIGAGTMGNGIAHIFARSGFDVTLCDVEQRFLDRGEPYLECRPRGLAGPGERRFRAIVAGAGLEAGQAPAHRAV